MRFHNIVTPILVAVASAEYTSFFYSSNNTCPGLDIQCEAPGSLCAYDGVVNKYYCCSGAGSGACKASAATCNGTDNGPSSSQQQCNTDGSTWCCLQDSERCTQRTGRTELCIATQANPITRVGQEILNDTFSSLSSANPAASTFSVDAISLASQAADKRSSSTATESASTTATPSASNNSSESISAGAIAGAAVGGVAAIAGIIFLAWFMLRRRRAQKHSAGSSSDSQTPKDVHPEKVEPTYTQIGSHAPQYQTAEAEGSHGWNEMAGEGNGLLGGVKEMPDTSARGALRELPG